MTDRSTPTPHNVSRFRLHTFVGRQAEIAQLTDWLQESPAVAITGFSGIGKSTLATTLAYALMPQFEDGVVWVSAFGSDEFRVYDIIRAIEDVLATGITSQPPDQWEILALQQLYGRRRLLILDEITQAKEETARRIAETIGHVGPGGPGRVILSGRFLPPAILDLVGPYHLHLRGLTEADASTLVTQTVQATPSSDDLIEMFGLSQGHPLALKLIAPIWNQKPEGQTDSTRDQLRRAIALHAHEDWDKRLEAIIDLALGNLEASQPAAAQLLTRFTVSSGSGDYEAMRTLYWPDLGPETDLKPTLDELARRGLLQHDMDEGRYLLHPALRRHLIAKRFVALPPKQQQELSATHAQYYLPIAQQYERTNPNQWNQIERDWANIRQGVEWVTRRLEMAADAPIESLLLRIDGMAPLGPNHTESLSVVRDYAMALRTYSVWRQPPYGFRWLAAGLLAAQMLGDSRSLTLIGGRFCTLSYFLGKYDLAEIWLRRSISAFESVDDKSRLSRVWADLGALFKAQGRYEESINACQQVKSINEVIEDWRGVGSALTRIGSIYYAANNLEKALTWHQDALDLFQKHEDQGGQAIAHNNIGLVYEALGEFQQAIHHYQESAELNETLNNVRGLITAYGNLGSAWYEHGNFLAALEWYQKDLALSESLGDWTGMAATLHNMGHVALEMDDLPAARDFFTRSRDLYARFGMSDFETEEETLIQIVQDRSIIRG